VSGLRPGNRHVMLLWAASAGSEGASWIMLVAVFVYVLRHFPASSLALLELAGTAPALLFMPFAGAIADRHDVRRLALGSMMVQALGLLGVLVVLRTGLWEIAACYGLQGAAGTVWPPARQRWLYALVREDRSRAAANAAIGSVSGVMTVAGAALGGALSAWSTSAALSAAAGLQLAATVPLLVLARPAFRQGARADGARRSLHADLAEGFTALRVLPLARSVIWIGISWGLIGGAYSVLLSAYVTDGLHGGGLLLGVFYVVDGAAVILGSVVAVRLRRGSHLAAYALAYVLQGAAWGAMFLGGQPAWGAALLAVMRTASGVIIALDTTILLATVPERLRGRITSLHMTTYGAASKVALAIFAGLLAVTGVRTVGIVAGAASVIAGAAWWWLNGRRARPLYMRAASVADAPDDPGAVAGGQAADMEEPVLLS
jgi:predicted MFS family arabinose efflux permease